MVGMINAYPVGVGPGNQRVTRLRWTFHLGEIVGIGICDRIDIVADVAGCEHE
jgi:hypothetical protein